MSAITEKFTAISELQQTDDACKLNVKKSPRKVIHFSDGTIEEFSSDEDEIEKSAAYTTEVNPSSMTWGPWLWYKAINAGSKSLEVCDYLGEHLASFFGITTPKYQYEIDEFNRMMEEEEERKRKEDLEMGGWNDTGTLTQDSPVKSEPPQNDKF
ncbi:hypothetical protein L9F63_017140 [Diploptera punctata]|uniref:Protein FAM177A1 n=1 Tax=Diploptera punctata TaxID=6984 RepID=A0AAD8A0B4_DIPPU|nr:hypothetical protein L9F63_017140 [Diploptera punctata]